MVHAAGLGGWKQVGALRVSFMLPYQQLHRLQVGPHVLIRMARTAAAPHTARHRRNTINRCTAPTQPPKPAHRAYTAAAEAFLWAAVLALYRMKFPRGKIGEIS